ncbi:MAG: DUF6290 family protein [Elusimicrobiota bacterium]|jgi:RHH-type rel operon transcriptional repressor/antitoxin RelB|nr:DUF6290 family protein [Elusimicrobiota bacterium]
MRQLNVKLDDVVMQRLDNIAKLTDRTKNYYAKQAIMQYLEDLEDGARAEKTLEKIARGEEEVYSYEEVMKENGL